MRVLLIEDSAAEIVILKKALRPFTDDITVAETGDDGVRHFSEAVTRAEPYDLILLDLKLPGMDGHEVLLSIRQEEERAHIGFDSTNVIILTGTVDNFESLQFATSAGVLDYLNKPISIPELHRALKKLGFHPKENHKLAPPESKAP